ncbi:ATP-binding protein [Kutzneria sp. NPDC052558]|uniref:ATP-binding protein n=1 Tax=Kutzneria sp. NPDC052558 TaxID=3364121 RepID=UPI0037C744CE
MDLAGLLRAHRVRTGLTQEELAERAGLSVDAIGLIERGERRRPQRHTVDQLVTALGLAGDDAGTFRQIARGRPAFPLPTPPTPLLGRDRELAEIEQLLSEARLVTLTGPGGVGKTRLALAVAARFGAAFVSLAELSEPAQVASEVERVRRHRPGLLVLDNFEHLLAARCVVPDLLGETKVLVTSRTPLNLTGEHRYEVACLPASTAVALFEQRARAVVPGFTTDAAVGPICHRLDGLPLAIELAAPWLRVLPPHELLDRCHALLTGGPHDSPPRQRTLAATLRWSYELLDPRQRELFATLAVFAGGFTERAAAAVCDATLAELTSLADMSLLTVSAGRFDMLETVRDFATRLGRTAPDRHAGYYRELVDGVELVGPDELAHRELLDRERANIHRALGHVVEQKDAAACMAFGRRLWRYRPLNRWLPRMIDVVGHDPELCLWAGMVARAHGDHDTAKNLFRACMTRCDSTLSATRVAAEHNLGVTYYEEGDYARAAELERRTLVQARASNSGYGVPFGLVSLGDVECARGDLDAAAACYEEGLGLFRRISHNAGMAHALTGLGRVALRRGADAEAAARFREGIATQGDPRFVIECVESLADLVDPAEATALRVEAAALREDHDAF